MHPRVLAIALTAVTALALGAPASQARDLAPGEAEWVITPADLQTPTGKVMDTSGNAVGPTIPTGCTNLDTGKPASGRNSLSSVFGEIDYRDGTTWQSSVWTYRTATAAQASFARLQRQTLALCNGSWTGLIGDDVATMPAAMVHRATRIAGATEPRFAVATSRIMLDPSNLEPGYSNAYTYSVFTLVDDAIVQVFVMQVKPVTDAQRADARRATTAIANRYADSM